MASMMEINVWVLVNSAGEYVAHEDEAALVEAYEQRVGELAESGGTRLIKLTVKVPIPEVIVMTGEVVEMEQVSELKVTT